MPSKCDDCKYFATYRGSGEYCTSLFGLIYATQLVVEDKNWRPPNTWDRPKAPAQCGKEPKD
jgi:hypothetical protein